MPPPHFLTCSPQEQNAGHRHRSPAFHTALGHLYHLFFRVIQHLPDAGGCVFGLPVVGVLTPGKGELKPTLPLLRACPIRPVWLSGRSTRHRNTPCHLTSIRPIAATQAHQRSRRLAALPAFQVHIHHRQQERDQRDNGEHHVRRIREERALTSWHRL